MSCSATEIWMRLRRFSFFQQVGVAPWYYEQVAILRAKKKDLEGAIAILERYERQVKAPGTGPQRLAQRLSQLRSKQR